MKYPMKITFPHENYFSLTKTTTNEYNDSDDDACLLYECI